MDAFDALLRNALVLTALLTLPVLAIATLVGATVAIVQAATQVQEQTLGMLPKMIAVGAMVVLYGRFGLAACAQLFAEIIARLPLLARG